MLAASNVESAGFSAVLLADTYLFTKGQSTIIFLQLVECVQKGSIAGSAHCILTGMPPQHLHAAQRLPTYGYPFRFAE